MVNYFENILKEINKKINGEDYKNAYNLITQELNLPYIPSLFEKKLWNLKNLVEEKLFVNANVNEKTIDESQIIEYLTAKKPVGNDINWIFSLEKINIRHLLSAVAIFLKNPMQDAFSKTFVLEILKSQEVDKEFIIYKYQETFKVNPIKLKSCQEYTYFQEVEKCLTLKLENNPNLLMSCVEIWKWFNYLIFPKFPIKYENKESWALTIMYYVLKLQKQDLNLNKLAKNYCLSCNDSLKQIAELDKIIKENKWI